MAIEQRRKLYAELEKIRERPLIVYVTSARENVGALMAADAIPEFLDQLEKLPADPKAADLLVVSKGGDPTVAWRIITLLRERVSKIGVLVPQAAYSAATLLALGANEIIMHPNGNLGPVDPQIQVNKPGQQEPQRFGFEELASFLEFAKDKVGLKDEKHIHAVFDLLSKEIGTVPLGTAVRASLLSLSMGEKLLGMHLEDKAAAHAIAEKLNKAFYHHGYPLGRTEAIDIGLKIADRNKDVERLMWEIWLDIEDELKVRSPFQPIFEVLASPPELDKIFAPVHQTDLPPGTPPIQFMAQGVPQDLLKGTRKIDPVKFQLIAAVMESTRHASRHIARGRVLAARNPDLTCRFGVIFSSSQWEPCTSGTTT
jgi:ATP-dependent protease ClpP protease subunit